MGSKFLLPFASILHNCFVSVEREQSNGTQIDLCWRAGPCEQNRTRVSSISANETQELKPKQICHRITVQKIKDFLLCEVVINFWLFFRLRHFHGRKNLPILMASLLRRTGGGVFGLELAPATGGIPTSVAFKNVGARLVGTVLPPFMTIVFSWRTGSLFERSREIFRFPEGEVLPSSATSIFLRCHRSFKPWYWCQPQSYAIINKVCNAWCYYTLPLSFCSKDDLQDVLAMTTFSQFSFKYI